MSTSDVIYVFLATPHGEDRKYRVAELGGRCFVARGLRNKKTVIGLATERYEKGKGFSFDLFYLHYPEWTKKDNKQMAYMQKEFGYFANPEIQSLHEDEYPKQTVKQRWSKLHYVERDSNGELPFPIKPLK